MKAHCDAGMIVPSGESADHALSRKKNLLKMVGRINGDKAFEDQKEAFQKHINDFATRYRLNPN